MPNEILSGQPTRERDFSIRSVGGLPVVDESYAWIVKSDTPFATTSYIASTPGLPTVNLSVSPNGIGICRSLNAVQRELASLYWDVTAEYSSAVDERSNIQNPQVDPVTWIPVYETKFERLQEVVTRDKNGDPIVNSANQPFDNGLTVSRFIPIWEFYQIEPPIGDEAVIARNETINSAIFKGRAVNTLLLTIMSSVVGFYYGQRRRLTQYAIRYNVRTWKHKRLDVGTVYKSGSDLLPYTDKYGNVIAGGLNGTGGKVSVGTDPSVLEFDMFDTLDFSTFLRI
jgi:hypothetical protein